MGMNSNMKLEVGDWVKGTVRNGALIHGYLQKVPSNFSKVDLRVVASDYEKIIGKTVRMDKRVIEKLEDITEYTDQQLINLIDLALETRDQTWFMELSTEWKQRKKDSTPHDKGNLYQSTDKAWERQ